MCDSKNCGIELKELTQDTPHTTEDKPDTPIVLPLRFKAYFSHSIAEPMDVHRVVLDTTTAREEADLPMYLLLTDGTVVVCRNFDVIIRDMAPVKEVFDLLQYLETQMMNRDMDKPAVEGYQ